jgi:hypothetical protein
VGYNFGFGPKSKFGRDEAQIAAHLAPLCAHHVLDALPTWPACTSSRPPWLDTRSSPSTILCHVFMPSLSGCRPAQALPTPPKHLLSLFLALCHGRARAAAMADPELTHCHCCMPPLPEPAASSRFPVRTAATGTLRQRRQLLLLLAGGAAAAGPCKLVAGPACHASSQSQAPQRVRAGPLWLPRPSAAAEEPPLAGISELQSAPYSNLRQGPRATIRLKGGVFLHCHRLK